MFDGGKRADVPGPATQLGRLLALAGPLEPMRIAVVHPCDANSLDGAVEARNMGLVSPILVGPVGKIERAAADGALDLADIEIHPAAHSHDAAFLACALVRDGRADAVMKGSLHSAELLGAIMQRGSGLRTDRRMSHVFVLDAPGFPRPLFLSDAAVNIAPGLATKRDIVQNAIDCDLALGVLDPRVAVLAAVETVHPAMPATVDAAALAKMAECGQIMGARVDGPLAFDNAVSADAADSKHIVSTVAGAADVLIAPNIEAANIEAANMAAKQLAYLASAQSAGLVMGARVPVVLTSRADGRLSRLAACAAAVLVARHERSKPCP